MRERSWLLSATGELIAFSDHFATFGDGKTPTRAAAFNASMSPAGLIQDLRYRQSMIPTVVTTGALRASGSNAICFASRLQLPDAISVPSDRPRRGMAASIARKHR